jgi:hypothetical protein
MVKFHEQIDLKVLYILSIIKFHWKNHFCCLNRTNSSTLDLQNSRTLDRHSGGDPPYKTNKPHDYKPPKSQLNKGKVRFLTLVIP